MMTPEKEKSLVIILFITAFLFYSFHLYSSLPSKNRFPGAIADRGKLLWQHYNCTACHQVYGLGGYLGPDLTNVYSKRGEGYIRSFLQNGTVVMPRFNLNDNDITAITAYLKDLDASGKADPKTFIINRDGTIEQ